MASLRDFSYLLPVNLCPVPNSGTDDSCGPLALVPHRLGFEFFKTFLFLALENFASLGADLVTYLSKYTLLYFSHFGV